MEFYNSKEVKTRKEHNCFLCNLKINIGTKVFYEAGKYEGDFFSRYSHLECSKEWNKQNKEADDGDAWGWFESVEDGNPKEWNQKIRRKYDIPVQKMD